jgi:inorganic pyrophosphatase
MRAVCPKNYAHDRFFTSVSVRQAWIVDSHGNYLETREQCVDVYKDVSSDEIWTCGICGAEAIVYDSNRPDPFELFNKKYAVTVERPLGFMHTKFNVSYITNYGFISGIYGGDGEPWDVYILGNYLKMSEGTLITCEIVGAILRENDNEDKLIGIPTCLPSIPKEAVYGFVYPIEVNYKHKLVLSNNWRS